MSLPNFNVAKTSLKWTMMADRGIRKKVAEKETPQWNNLQKYYFRSKQLELKSGELALYGILRASLYTHTHNTLVVWTKKCSQVMCMCVFDMCGVCMGVCVCVWVCVCTLGRPTDAARQDRYWSLQIIAVCWTEDWWTKDLQGCLKYSVAMLPAFMRLFHEWVFISLS